MHADSGLGGSIELTDKSKQSSTSSERSVKSRESKTSKKSRKPGKKISKKCRQKARRGLYVNDYLVLSVLVSLGQPIFGLGALYYAVKCRRFAREGDVKEAWECSTRAFKFSLVAIGLLCVTLLLLVFFIIYVTTVDADLVFRNAMSLGRPVTTPAPTTPPPTTTTTPDPMLDPLFVFLLKRYGPKAPGN